MADVVIITVHNRPWYLRQTLEAWRQVRGVRDWIFVFGIEPTDQKLVNLKLIQEFAEWGMEVRVQENPEKFGVLLNPMVTAENAFTSLSSGFTVFGEEDVEPAADVLEYMEWCRDQYRRDQSVLAACAWTDGPGGPEEAVFRRRWFAPWIWGTWRDRWLETLAPTWDADYSSQDHRGPGGWDCNIGLRLVHDLSKDVLFPAQARAKHIGKWAGVHQDPNRFDSELVPTDYVWEREPVKWREV